MKIRERQFHQIVLSDRARLIHDMREHLLAYRPAIVAAYPPRYLTWAIDDSLAIAAGFGLDDVQMLRVFVRLRWDVAAGFYKQPDIARVLADRSLTPAERFDRLAGRAFEPAWEAARAFDGPEEWRDRFWADRS
jgi:hypothetical protein